MLNKAINSSIKYTFLVVSDNQKVIISLANYVILCGVISVFGTISNIVNMIVFYRQGLNTTINISFFSLALSDLCGLILQQLFNIYLNPLFVNLDLPIAYTELQYITTAVTREMFARITCLITAFITAERCLCVVFPLHVKQIITPKKSTTIIIAIYIFTLISPVPVYFTSYITWKLYPDSNRTLLGLAFTNNHFYTESFVYLTHAFFTLLGFTFVSAFTVVLIIKLRQKNAWRQAANVDQETAKSMTKRDNATVKMVIIIASILVICYGPAVLLCLVTFLVPEFRVGGKHYNLYYSVWTFAILFENVNSSVNIFLYYRMSSKYKRTFRDLFSWCIQEYKRKESKAVSE